jgi:putative hydrolase of the HAD superfamily
MAIRAVCFDLDDTLIDSTAAERVGALRFAERFRGQLTPGEDFHARWRAATAAAFERYLAGEIPFTEQRRARVRALCADAPGDAEADARFAVYLEGYRAEWRLFADVLPILDALRALPLGIISNAPLAQQREKLVRTGIADRFATIQTPDRAGSGKPHAAIFHATCADLGCAPHECLHVGDHLDHDALGACAAGLRGVWLDRSGAPAGSPGVERVDSLAGLLPRLGRLLAAHPSG